MDGNNYGAIGPFERAGADLLPDRQDTTGRRDGTQFPVHPQMHRGDLFPKRRNCVYVVSSWSDLVLSCTKAECAEETRK